MSPSSFIGKTCQEQQLSVSPSLTHLNKPKYPLRKEVGLRERSPGGNSQSPNKSDHGWKDGSEKVSHQRACCRLKPPAAVMDCRTVIIFLLIAQAACGPVKTTAKALSDTIKLMQEEIRTALGALAEPGVLPPNTSCHSLNTTELGGSEPLTAHHLSLFRCYMMKMSKLTTDVSHELVTASQYSQDVERLTSNGTDNRDCQLPAFEQEMDRFVYVKCLLEHLQQRLNSTTFGV